MVTLSDLPPSATLILLTTDGNQIGRWADKLSATNITGTLFGFAWSEIAGVRLEVIDF